MCTQPCGIMEPVNYTKDLTTHTHTHKHIRNAIFTALSSTNNLSGTFKIFLHRQLSTCKKKDITQHEILNENETEQLTEKIILTNRYVGKNILEFVSISFPTELM